MHNQAISEMLAAPSCWQKQLPCRTARAGNLPFESDVVIVGAGIGGLADWRQRYGHLNQVFR